MPRAESGRRMSFRVPAWLAVILASSMAPALAQVYGPLTRTDFKMIVGPGAPMPQGLGDRQNSWAWSMAWFKGKLVLGTARSYDCMVSAAIHRFVSFIPYPPIDPDELCTPNYHDLPLRAEIWTWTPETKLWTRVYQAPEDVPNPEAAGKLLARDVGYRYMHVHREPDGTEALYISALSSRFIYGAIVNNGRLLRTTDLVNFDAVPAAPGTILGNIANAGFRGLTSYKGRLYIIGGSIEGTGVVLEAVNPKLGNSNFRVITPPGELASEIEVFNNHLYLSMNDWRGFRVVKTSADGLTVPYTFTEVIPFGGGRTWFPNQNVWSMKVFNNRLYIGGNGVQSLFGAEFYRINPDDTWELLSGDPRTISGEPERRPLSGLSPGFGWGLNAHMWRQEVFDGRLYIGTFDMATIFKDIPIVNDILSREMGADLWYTNDGVYYYPVDEQGFQDKFNFGFRTLLSTAHGLFVGTANYYYGLQIYQGVPFGFAAARAAQTRLSPPQRLDLEYTGGKALLAWERPPGAKRFRIFRSTSALTPLDPKIASGPVSLSQTYRQIGATDKTWAADPSVNPLATYTYYVQAEDDSTVSGRSNLVAYPASPKPVTAKEISAFIAACAQRNCFTSYITYLYVLSQFTSTVQAALRGDVTPLTRLQMIVKLNQFQNGTLMQPHAAEDLELRLARLIKRYGLYKEGLVRLTDL